MPIIKFPNGTEKKFKKNVSILEIIKSVNKKILNICIGGIIDNKFFDMHHIINNNSNIIFITIKDKLGIEILKNSFSYLLGYAIKTIWPESKMISYGSLKNNFYYDIYLKYKLIEKDFIKIQKKVLNLTQQDFKILKKKVPWKVAHEIFLQRNETYKLIFLEKIKKNSFVTLYFCKKYVDISEKVIFFEKKFFSNFKLEKIQKKLEIHRNEKNYFQRIYGKISFDDQRFNNQFSESLINRDHRKINQNLSLYHIQPETPGMIFWHPNGWIIFKELKKYIRIQLKKYQYQEVKGPTILDRNLWKKTGHWEFYKESMFITASENRNYCIKPMNCPGHVQIFNQELKSYRNLPVRIAEFGICHRNESSGSLHGLIRSREFTQDDAHIFCTKNQIQDEVSNCIKMILETYKIFGFKNFSVKLSTKPKKSIGNEEIWFFAEKNLKNALKKNNIKFVLQDEEGAFYGPKIEFTLHDCVNREWQCGTIQLDFFLAERLKAFYIDMNNIRQVPIVIHRAILGSIERFIGILIEEYEGFFPTWLAPIQIVIINVNEKHISYIKKINKKLNISGIRAKSDLRNEKIGFKIREHTLNRIPYILICGDEEINNKKISVRTYHGKNFKCIEIDSFIKKIHQEIHKRLRYQLEE